MDRIKIGRILGGAACIVTFVVLMCVVTLIDAGSKDTDLDRAAFIANTHALFFDWRECNERAATPQEEFACANEFYPEVKATREDILNRL